MSTGPLRSYRCAELFDASRFEPHITVKYLKLLDCVTANRLEAFCHCAGSGMDTQPLTEQSKANLFH